MSKLLFEVNPEDLAQFTQLMEKGDVVSLFLKPEQVEGQVNIGPSEVELNGQQFEVFVQAITQTTLGFLRGQEQYKQAVANVTGKASDEIWMVFMKLREPVTHELPVAIWAVENP